MMSTEAVQLDLREEQERLARELRMAYLAMSEEERREEIALVEEGLHCGQGVGREEIESMAIETVTAEGFWMAFQTLSVLEQRAVIERLLQDNDFREDLMDIALIEKRRDEPSRSLREYLAERQHKGLT